MCVHVCVCGGGGANLHVNCYMKGSDFYNDCISYHYYFFQDEAGVSRIQAGWCELGV